MNIEGVKQRIPISVLTGFLGSGKTTILKHFVRSGDLSRTLVLINEFGEDVNWEVIESALFRILFGTGPNYDELYRISACISHISYAFKVI